MSLVFAATGCALAATLAATGSLTTTGCGAVSAGGGTGNQNPAGPPIVLGASISLTGSLGGNANAMQGGLLAAVQEINGLGGILGRTVQVSTQDDKSDPTQVLSIAKSLAGANVSSLLGPITSQMVSNVEPFVQMSKLVELSSTATSAQLTQGDAGPKNGFFFRTVPSDAYQAVAVALFALEGPHPDAGAPQGDGGTSGASGCTRMDVVHNNDTYGNPLSVALEAYFTANGGTVPSDIPVPSSDSGSYTQHIATILKDLPQCLVLAVYPQTAAEIMHELSDSLAGGAPTGWPKAFFVIATDGAYDPSLITAGRASASNPSSQSWVNGTFGPPMYGTVAFSSDHTRQQYNDLLAIYTAEVGLKSGSTDMDPYTSNQFDAAVLVLLAMEAAGTSTNGAAIQKAMFNVSRGKMCGANPYGPADLADAISTLRTGGDINYQGASGNVDFDDYGDVIGDFLIWQVQGSAFANYTTISSTKLAAAQASVDAGGCQ